MYMYHDCTYPITKQLGILAYCPAFAWFALHTSSSCTLFHYVEFESQFSLSLSLFRSELTGTSEGGKTGPAGGGDYVVSSKWARDRDINLKIRSIYHVYTVYMHTYVCMYSRMYMYMYINVESLQC